jgi:hypothetical protein
MLRGGEDEEASDIPYGHSLAKNAIGVINA